MTKLGPEFFDLLNAKQNVGNQTHVVYGKGGMSLKEISEVEKQLGFQMPEDFRYLLQNIKDAGDVLFPWANFEKEAYDDLINWVQHGIEFDIQHNVFWLKERWGTRPTGFEDCLAIFRKDFPSWPKLLPIYSHRFLAAEPCLSDNPVFSIKQTDIIYYGTDLANYLMNEFVKPHGQIDQTGKIARKIEIWADIELQDF